jgi:uncharacterized membrane protein
MRKRLMLGAVLLVAMTLLAVPAIVLAGGGSSKSETPDNAKAARTSPAAEQLRAERRESFRHTGCSKRAERKGDV